MEQNLRLFLSWENLPLIRLLKVGEICLLLDEEVDDGIGDSRLRRLEVYVEDSLLLKWCELGLIRRS